MRFVAALMLAPPCPATCRPCGSPSCFGAASPRAHMKRRRSPAVFRSNRLTSAVLAVTVPSVPHGSRPGSIRCPGQTSFLTRAPRPVRPRPPRPRPRSPRTLAVDTPRSAGLIMCLQVPRRCARPFEPRRIFAYFSPAAPRRSTPRAGVEAWAPGKGPSTLPAGGAWGELAVWSGVRQNRSLDVGGGAQHAGETAAGY